jgi:hypothetical protein
METLVVLEVNLSKAHYLQVCPVGLTYLMHFVDMLLHLQPRIPPAVGGGYFPEASVQPHIILEAQEADSVKMIQRHPLMGHILIIASF